MQVNIYKKGELYYVSFMKTGKYVANDTKNSDYKKLHDIIKSNDLGTDAMNKGKALSKSQIGCIVHSLCGLVKNPYSLIRNKVNSVEALEDDVEYFVCNGYIVNVRDKEVIDQTKCLVTMIPDDEDLHDTAASPPTPNKANP